MVIQYCYYLEHKCIRKFDSYCILGDDIGIWDEMVARRYLSFMKSTGVEINLSKSVIGNNSGEFAKRHFLNGTNISGFGYQMVMQAYASAASWVRFHELLEYEGFFSEGGLNLISPHTNGLGLPKRAFRELNHIWALRLGFAQRLLIATDNVTLSYADLQEYYIHERIALLSKQSSSFLPRNQMENLIKKIQKLSRQRGQAVVLTRLDISFSTEGEFNSHPIVRYLNERNNTIWDKIEAMNEMLKTGLYSQGNTIRMLEYSQEEYIPSLNLDSFFTEDTNEYKALLKISVQQKAFRKLIRSLKS
jgi:hypothetical protein